MIFPSLKKKLHYIDIIKLLLEKDEIDVNIKNREEITSDGDENEDFNISKSYPGYTKVRRDETSLHSVFALLLFDISKIIKIHQKFIKYFSKISEYF